MFVAVAGNREVARFGRGHMVRLAQYFVRVGGVQIFVAGAGKREVASCGGGDCRCDIGIGCEWVLSGGAGIVKLLGRAA